MRVVGVDQSYTGFGFSVDGEAKKKNFPIAKYDNEVHRLIEMRSWWMQWLSLQKQAGIDLVVMEGYAHATKFGREQAGELGGMIKMAVWDVLKEPPLVVSSGGLKKFVTGSGGSKKNTMILHVFKRWGVEFSDDNQADAFSLEKFGYAYLDIMGGITPPGTYPKFQVEAVHGVNQGK